jgi:hypothetical protein
MIRKSLFIISAFTLYSLFIIHNSLAFTGPTAAPPNNAGQVLYQSAGNVGIGTTNPVYKLDLGSGGEIRLANNNALRWTGGTQIYDSGTSLIIQPSGNVGIGTSTPGYPLTVVGNVWSSGSFIGALSGNISAANVTGPAAFGSNYGTYNYAAPGAFAVGTTTVTGLPTNGLFVAGNVGIGTTTPATALHVVTPNFDVGILQRTALGGFANFAIKSFTGGGVLRTVNLRNELGDLALDVDGVSNAIQVRGTTGNVGIGTTTPSYKLDVSGAMRLIPSSAPTAARGVMYYDTTASKFKCSQDGSTFVDCISAGSLTGAGQANYIPLWTTATNLATSTIYQSGSNIGIGTTTPSNPLTVSGNANITGTLTVGSCVGCGGGGGGVATTSPFSAGYIPFATSSSAITNSVIFQSGSNVGIGTTTPTALLSVGTTTTGLVAVFGGGSGKINVGTVDPIYTIGGKKYATYLPSITGVKEETTGILKLNKESGDKNYEYTINFATAEEGSDFWLFYQITDFGSDWENLAVLLTPNFDGKVWYEKDAKNKKITIFAQLTCDKEQLTAGQMSNVKCQMYSPEISYRLTAPRFDWKKWTNATKDDGDGFVLDIKP